MLDYKILMKSMILERKEQLLLFKSLVSFYTLWYDL